MLATGDGGGTYRILFRVEMAKIGAKIQKRQKKICHYVAKTFISAKVHFIQCLSGPTARGGGRCCM